MELSENMNNTINNIVEFGHKLEDAQARFIQSDLFNIINKAVDCGIRIALPEVAEDVVIDVKDKFIENGFENGIKEIWNDIKETGKSIFGLASGKFESIEQVEMAIKSGGILDSISKIFDFALDKVVDSGKISKEAKKSIKNQKNSIIKDVKNSISSEFENQISYVEKIRDYNKKWNESYENRDLKGMKNANKNIQKYLQKTLPLENVLKESRKIEILQKLIQNSGNFDFSNYEKELAEVLVN